MPSTIKVVDLLSDAQTLLTDQGGTRWPLTELQRWLNAAYREIINIRPDASSDVGEFECAAGVRQNLTDSFSNATKLIEVVRNTATLSAKQAISLVDRNTMNEQRPSWPTDPASIDIENYIYDPRLPLSFMVYPPALSSARLEVIYNSVPLPHALTLEQLQNSATTEVIRLVDTYANMLLDYVMYRAFMKDTEVQGSANLATLYYQAFKDSLGVKTSGDGASQPGVA